MIPPELGKLTNLEILSLLYNKIKVIPPEIGNLDNLQHLTIAHNKIKVIPPEIVNLQKMEKICYHILKFIIYLMK